MGKLLADFVPEMQYQVRDCPQPIVERELRRAVIDFCERSRFWRRTLDSMSVFNSYTDVDLILPANSTVAGVIWATHNGDRLDIVTDRGLIAATRDDRTGTPTAIYVEDSKAHLAPIPGSNYDFSLVVRVALKPTATATEVDDRLVDHFNDTLIDGALARLLMMKDFSWYDPKLAQYYREMFAEGVFRAKRKANGEDQPVVRTVKYGGY